MHGMRHEELVTMNKHTYSRRIFNPHNFRVFSLLVALAWSNLAFGGEIQDAAQIGDLEKVKALLKGNPKRRQSRLL